MSDSTSESADDRAARALRAARRRQAALLSLWGVLGGVAVLPYALALQADRLAEIVKKGGPSLLQLGAIGAVQTGVLVVGAVLLGLAAARRTGLGAPVSWALACGAPIAQTLARAFGSVRRFLVTPIVLGLGLGLVAALVDGLLFMPLVPELRALGHKALRDVALWKGALACLYGGITEEILLRLLGMSGITLLLKRLWPGASARPAGEPLPALLLWIASGIAALLFALGHLPAAKALMPLGPLVIVRILVLNAGLGLAFGWLYMRRGLEAAMLGHFCADVVLHIVAPAFLLWRGLPG